MDLHPECQRRLHETLVEVLPQLEVRRGNLLNLASMRSLEAVSAILPTRERLQAADWVSEDPVTDFLFAALSEELRSSSEFSSAKPEERLVDLPSFVDTNAVATRLVTALMALPKRYALLVKLPLKLTSFTAGAFGRAGTQISDSLVLTQGNSLRDSVYPLAEGGDERFPLSLLVDRQRGPTEWETESIYLKADLQGYITDFLKTSTVENFEFTVRSLAGIGLAIGLLSLRTTYTMFPQELAIFVYERSTTGEMELRRSQLIQAEYGDKLDKLDWGEILLRESDDKAGRFLKNRLVYLSIAFSPIPELERLRRAGQWYFDSLCGTSELLSYVQGIVGLEIVLGEKGVSDLVGLGELLANRCAYLIGKTSNDRSEVLKKFRAIYDTRSQIVHRGKNRLTGPERRNLWELRWMCQRVIQEELELAVADKRREWEASPTA